MKMHYRDRLKDKKKIVVKVGTSTLTHSNGKLNLMRIEKLVRVLADLNSNGKQVILVSSGAIATGAAKMGITKKPSDKIKKQALAAIGQAELIRIYDKFFEEYNKTCAQILVTKDGIVNSVRRRNARNTINELLSMGIIPVINENDTVSTHEIEFGDNDTLSAAVATMINADLLIILSDIDGMFTSDPRLNTEATLVNEVFTLDDLVESYVSGTASVFGTGGMSSKIIAARHCMDHEVDMIITNGEDPSVIFDVLEGKEVGTLFVSKQPCCKKEKVIV
jgi:glutamate 5-kinase